MRGVWISILAAGLSLGAACAAPPKKATYVISVPGKGVMICRMEPRLGSHIEHRVCRPPKHRQELREDLILSANRRRGNI